MRALPSACPSSSLPGSLSRHLGTAVAAICRAVAKVPTLTAAEVGAGPIWAGGTLPVDAPRARGSKCSCTCGASPADSGQTLRMTQNSPFLQSGSRVQSSFLSQPNSSKNSNIHVQHGWRKSNTFLLDIRSWGPNKSAHIAPITSLTLPPCGRGLPRITVIALLHLYQFTEDKFKSCTIDSQQITTNRILWFVPPPSPP